MRLDELVTKLYPVGDLYMPEIRTEWDPWMEPLYLPPPYACMLQQVIIQGEDMVEDARRRHAAGFPARIRLGRHVWNERGLGTRKSPLDMPEALTGALIAVSI